MRLGKVNVVTGENGVGKSNVYRALEMVQRMAQGRFAAAVAGEATESLLSEVRDAAAYPAIFAARETMLAWRFFDHFPAHLGAPIRRPAVGFWSPELDSDGGNLAANLQTLIESGRSKTLDKFFQKAFPDCRWAATDEMGLFQLKLLRPGLKRWLDASELSEGTLRFFFLCAALLSLKPASLMVFNEPESSLHLDLLEPLAELISRAALNSQILIVTHSIALAELISEKCETRRIDLINHEGQTMNRNDLSETGGKVWHFDE